MSQRKNTDWKHRVKDVSHWLFDNGYPALFWAGLTVNFSMLLFEETMEEHSCVSEGNHYFKDVAKQLFWAIFISRLLLPLFLKLLKKKINSESWPRKQTVSRLEAEVNDAIETGVFVFETANSTGLPYQLAIIIALPAVWPAFGSIYRFFDCRFVRGPRAAYEHYATRWRHTFTGFESLYNALSLSSAISFLLSYLLDVLYQSTHKKPFKYRDYVIWPLIFISAGFGGCSVFGKKAWKMMNYSEAFINVFYYSFNMTVSSINCINPDSFTDSGFVESGWIYVTVLTFICFGLAVVGGFHGSENPYIEEDEDKGYEEISEADEKERKGGCCAFFRRFRKSKLDGMGSVGLDGWSMRSVQSHS